jgi:hypothetical protein
MKTAMIGDNCIDVYVRINGEVVNRRYPTGNCVDTGVNLRAVGESIIERVSYEVTQYTGTKVRAVNVYIDSMLVG